MIWAILSLGLTSWQRAGGRVPAVLFEEYICVSQQLSISVTNLKYLPTLGVAQVVRKMKLHAEVGWCPPLPPTNASACRAWETLASNR